MIQTNTPSTSEQASYHLPSGFFSLRDREHRQRSSRQKFVIEKSSMAVCWESHVVDWGTADRLGFAAAFHVSAAGPPNSADELFRDAAEKVSNKIVINRKIYGGAPCVANTRVPVYAILEMIEEGCSHKQILKAFPSIGKEGLEAALRFSALVMER